MSDRAKAAGPGVTFSHMETLCNELCQTQSFVLRAVERAGLQIVPAAPPTAGGGEDHQFDYLAVSVTLTRLIREHLQNCLRTIRDVDCPDLTAIVVEWARKIAHPPPEKPEPLDPMYRREMRGGWLPVEKPEPPKLPLPEKP